MEEQKEEKSFESMLAEHEARADKLEPGQKVSGQIISISGDDVFVDIGLKLDGIMDRKELLDAHGEQTKGPGDTVEAFVTSVTSQGARLSRSMSGSGIAALEDAMAAGIPVEGKVIATCKGGYQVNVLGRRAFCPGSQMEYSQSGDNEEFVGREMPFLITRIEGSGKNIVVSRRALVERERSENMAAFLDKVKPGDIVEGVVTRLAPFGAFIELAPSIEGMAHLSELSWARPAKPEDAVSVGEKVAVKVLEMKTDDKGRQRISLSIRQAAEDPWNSVETRFKPGEIVEGTVTRFAPFGAFVELAPGIEGLAHISELSWEKRVHKPEDVLKIGEKTHVKIRELNPQTRRISLSIRDAKGDPWLDAVEKFPQGAVVTGVVESKSPYGIFVNLAPGVTALLPQSALKNAASASELNKLEPGNELTAKVQKLDSAQRRISLMPLENEKPVEDKNWREHSRTVQEAPSLGALGQALQDALKKRKQG